MRTIRTRATLLAATLALTGMGTITMAASAAPLPAQAVAYTPVGAHGDWLEVTARGRVEYMGTDRAACSLLLGPHAGCADAGRTSGSYPTVQVELPPGARATGVSVTWDRRGYWITTTGPLVSQGDAAKYPIGVPPHAHVVAVHQWLAHVMADGAPQEIVTTALVETTSGAVESLLMPMEIDYLR